MNLSEMKPKRKDLITSIVALIDNYDRATCTHEETYRGGAIWTFCHCCDRKWADDGGGFVPYEEPKFITDARNQVVQYEDAVK